MCYTAKSKKERTKRTASKDIIVYKVAVLIDDHIESIYQDYMYLPNIVNKHVKLHYKHTTYTYRYYMEERVFKGYTIDKGYYSYISKELCRSNLLNFKAATCVKYKFIYKPVVLAECIIPKGTKYCINKEGVVISETIIYTGKYKLLM